MIKNKGKRFIKDKVKRSALIKYKYINIIKKSIFHNRNIKLNNKVFMYYKINNYKLTSKKIKNMCLVSGEHNSVNKKLLLSRFQINYSAIINKLQNFKPNS